MATLLGHGVGVPFRRSRAHTGPPVPVLRRRQADVEAVGLVEGTGHTLMGAEADVAATGEIDSQVRTLRRSSSDVAGVGVVSATTTYTPALWNPNAWYQSPAFTDTGGVTPLTVVEQLAARMNNLGSLAGVPALQSDATKRPAAIQLNPLLLDYQATDSLSIASNAISSNAPCVLWVRFRQSDTTGVRVLCSFNGPTVCDFVAVLQGIGGYVNGLTFGVSLSNSSAPPGCAVAVAANTDWQSYVIVFLGGSASTPANYRVYDKTGASLSVVATGAIAQPSSATSAIAMLPGNVNNFRGVIASVGRAPGARTAAEAAQLIAYLNTLVDSPPAVPLPRRDDMVSLLLPNDLLAVNFDGSGGAPAANSPLAYWGDQRTGRAWRQATAGAQPLRRLSAMDGGRPAIDFGASGLPDLLMGSAAVTTTGDVSIVMELQLDSIPASGEYVLVMGFGNGSTLWLANLGGFPSYSWRGPPSTGTTQGWGAVNGGSLTTSRVVLAMTCVVATNTVRARVNGVEQTVVSSFSSSLTTLAIGGHTDPLFPYALDGLVGVTAVWSGAVLTTAELQQAEAALRIP